MVSTVESSVALVIVDPNGRRTRVPLFPFPFRIGRAADNSLVLRDSRVSRNHAQISHDGGRYYLEDLGSRHGVWVNGERVAKARPDGYTLLLGSSTTFTMLPALRPHLAIAAENTWAPVGLVATTAVSVSWASGVQYRHTVWRELAPFPAQLGSSRVVDYLEKTVFAWLGVGPGTAALLIGFVGLSALGVALATNQR